MSERDDYAEGPPSERRLSAVPPWVVIVVGSITVLCFWLAGVWAIARFAL